LQQRRLSPTSIMHYIKLVFRSALFLAGLWVYVENRLQRTGKPLGGYDEDVTLWLVIWVIYFVEMILRFFPAPPIESMGCQKQFSRNFISTNREEAVPRWHSGWRTFSVAAAWLILNGIIGVLYFAGWIDRGILLLISLAYGVCDMICILFFCPFQTWFMKNKCCTTCRIYNWDYAMMFTPLVFIRGYFTWSLVLGSLLLLLRWEITVRRHPERFSEATNDSLTCRNCKEKLCAHKKQLQHFLVVNRKRLHLSGNALMENIKGKITKK